MTKVIAHRGASTEAPENTLAAFHLALIQGADGLELDVQMTKDGELVVIHDETLDRTTSGKGHIYQHSYSELSEYDAGSWFSGEFRGERIPRLSEVMDLLHVRDMLLNIELKTTYIQYPGIEERLADVLGGYSEQRVVVSSFNHYSLRTLKSIAPNIPIGLLYMEGLVEPWVYAERMGAFSLHPFYLNIIPELVEGCRKAGIALLPWTVDKRKDINKIVASKVEGIIPNRPAECRQIIGGIA